MRIARGLLLLLLTGCAVNTPPPDAATITVEARPGATPPLARGGTQLVVRTVSAADPRQEVRGAACRAEAPWFTADFVTPTRLLLPDYGASAPVVVVDCRAGELSGRGQAQPQAAWSGGLGGWPAVGISVGTGDVSGVGVGVGWAGGGAGVSSGEPVVRYPDLRIVLQ
jgi:hypothetical protein